MILAVALLLIGMQTIKAAIANPVRSSALNRARLLKRV
jgi:hypothetical protein